MGFGEQATLFVGMLVIGSALASCSTPTQRLAARATALGLQREIIVGAPYRHLVYFKSGITERTTLHVYIEHDGSPWRRNTEVASDPTPRNPLMFDLMALDSHPSLYLARPCYFEVDESPPCSPLLWTHRRYSEEVVDSMAAVLGKFVAAHPHDGIAFFGYSGGGALAVLLAERFPATRAIVTVAGNLDPDAWTNRHDFSPLTGSLNPASRPALPGEIIQKHYAGQRDRNVPPEVARAYARQRLGVRVIEVAQFDHRCCWKKMWPTILVDLETDLAERRH